MAVGKKAVRIRIESQGGGQTTKLQAAGELYETATGASYVRYPEPDPELGNTTTTVKWNTLEIRVLRHGDVESDQTFVSGARMSGSYKLPSDKRMPEGPKRLLLETVTHTMAHQKRERGYSVKWKYELYVDGQSTGIYKLKLDIEEA